MQMSQSLHHKRNGTTLVETAMVVSVFFLLLFGIIEYCRFIYFRQTVTNAAREGARYAVVNTYSDTVENDTINFVNEKMFGLENTVQNYNVEVFASDASAKKIGEVGDAEFGEYIVVEVKCDYVPFLPEFLFMGSSIPIQTRSLMYSEAN